MKATSASRMSYLNAPNVRYPNAASRRQVLHKALDFLVITASGIGIGAMVLFILANS